MCLGIGLVMLQVLPLRLRTSPLPACIFSFLSPSLSGLHSYSRRKCAKRNRHADTKEQYHRGSRLWHRIEQKIVAILHTPGRYSDDLSLIINGQGQFDPREALVNPNEVC
jgi:hypothetical protein